MELVLATHNEHKRREFARLLAPAVGRAEVIVRALAATVLLPPETGSTFAENALRKARTAAAATARACIADDSGIEAAALGEVARLDVLLDGIQGMRQLLRPHELLVAHQVLGVPHLGG